MPDFVFWLQKGNEYHILYIDPKGTEHRSYEHKVEGYRDLFINKETEQVKEFELDNKKLKVHLRLATDDTSVFAEKDYFKKYWIENDEFDIKLDE